MVSFRAHLALSEPTGQPVVPRRRGFHLWFVSSMVACSVTIGLLGLAALELSAASPVDAWLTTQTNIQSWSAAVKQIRSFKTLAQPLEEHGRVWFSAPNKFRWEIGTPAKTIAIREPNQMLVIYPKLKRAERFPLDGQAGPWKETLALLEAGFPRSQAELEARFKIMSQSCSNQLCEVRLQPRAAAARRMMPELRIAFAEGNLMLRATELHFADGSYIRNEFSDAALNPALEPGIFQPQLEADIQVVEPLKQKNP